MFSRACEELLGSSGSLLCQVRIEPNDYSPSPPAPVVDVGLFRARNPSPARNALHQGFPDFRLLRTASHRSMLRATGGQELFSVREPLVLPQQGLIVLEASSGSRRSASLPCRNGGLPSRCGLSKRSPSAFPIPVLARKFRPSDSPTPGPFPWADAVACDLKSADARS